MLEELKTNIREEYPSIFKSVKELRYILARKEYCPYCREMVPLKPGGVPVIRKYATCVHCNSLERHRFLFYVYQVEFLSACKKLKLLHFAPEKSIYDLISGRSNIDYTTCDLNPAMYPFANKCQKVNALKTGFPNDCFDIILANHLIEHIPEHEFLEEMKRILKPSGRLLVSTMVFDELEHTFEDEKIIEPIDREKYYGHPEHLRKYGRDIHHRLKKYFEVRYLKSNSLPPFGDRICSNCFILNKNI